MRTWTGSEIVLDAGSGPGSMAKILAARLPRGRIYAVDQDSSMVKQARQNLVGYDNVSILQSDMSEVQLPEKVDVIFSNAAVHWVLDHQRVFSHFRTLLREKGELLIQCGGQGNLKANISIIDR